MHNFTCTVLLILYRYCCIFGGSDSRLCQQY